MVCEVHLINLMPKVDELIDFFRCGDPLQTSHPFAIFHALAHRISSRSFTFPIHSEQPAQKEMTNYKEMGLVMAVKAEAIPKFRKKLEALVSE
jgi:hypothetical protein